MSDELSKRLEEFRVGCIELCSRTGIVMDYDTISLANTWFDIRALNMRVCRDFQMYDGPSNITFELGDLEDVEKNDERILPQTQE